MEEESKQPEEIPVPEIISVNPQLYSLVTQFLSNYHLCHECIGRQFSYLGTAIDNTTRANAILLGLTMEAHALLINQTLTKQFLLFNENPATILMNLVEKARFQPAYHVLKKVASQLPHLTITLPQDPDLRTDPFTCDLCYNLLTHNSITNITKQIDELSRPYEFRTFSVNHFLFKPQANQEDDFRARFNVHNGESFKANLNRLIGKQLMQLWQKSPDLEDPNLKIFLSITSGHTIQVEFSSKSLYLRGRYNKWVRNLPQTHWNCPQCHGHKTEKYTRVICSACGGSGDYLPSSIQDLLKDPLLDLTKGEDVLFHGAGREDIDVRCLGLGRPFIVEVINPKLKTIDLERLSTTINREFSEQIHITLLQLATKADVLELKDDSEHVQKEYNTLVYLSQPINEDEFNIIHSSLQEIFTTKVIFQRTPLRVVHRRADKTREKRIYSIRGRYLDPYHLFFDICAQGGTYIKELVSGDEGRTSPSLSEIFEIPMISTELDVIYNEE